MNEEFEGTACECYYCQYPGDHGYSVYPVDKSHIPRIHLRISGRVWCIFMPHERASIVQKISVLHELIIQQ